MGGLPNECNDHDQVQADAGQIVHHGDAERLQVRHRQADAEICRMWGEFTAPPQTSPRGWHVPCGGRVAPRMNSTPVQRLPFEDETLEKAGPRPADFGGKPWHQRR
jgi:hypothetical protein